MRSRKRAKRERILLWILFLIYLAVMVYFLFFAEMFGRGDPGISGHNFVPFQEIGRYLRYWRRIGLWLVAVNLGGNILAFVPFGLILPMLQRAKVHYARILLAGFLTTCLVEFTQLITGLGTCDVDDIILNSLGCLWGLILYYLGHRLRQRRRGRRHAR